jgi:hypothetical protein
MRVTCSMVMASRPFTMPIAFVQIAPAVPASSMPQATSRVGRDCPTDADTQAVVDADAC